MLSAQLLEDMGEVRCADDSPQQVARYGIPAQHVAAPIQQDGGDGQESAVCNVHCRRDGGNGISEGCKRNGSLESEIKHWQARLPERKSSSRYSSSNEDTLNRPTTAIQSTTSNSFPFPTHPDKIACIRTAESANHAAWDRLVSAPKTLNPEIPG